MMQSGGVEPATEQMEIINEILAELEVTEHEAG